MRVQGALPDHADRRADPRYPVSAAAEALDFSSNLRLMGRATDLGMGGCYVDTISPFPVGTAIRVRLFSERHSFQTPATVTYALGGMGMGLAFSETSPEQSTSLCHWVAQLSGEGTPYPERDLEGAFIPERRSTTSANLRDIVGQMVGLLRQKRVLTEAEANDLLHKLSE